MIYPMLLHKAIDNVPSEDDFPITKHLQKAGTCLSIQVFNHLIFSHDASYTSLKERGYALRGEIPLLWKGENAYRSLNCSRLSNRTSSAKAVRLPLREKKSSLTKWIMRRWLMFD